MEWNSCKPESEVIYVFSFLWNQSQGETIQCQGLSCDHDMPWYLHMLLWVKLEKMIYTSQKNFKEKNASCSKIEGFSDIKACLAINCIQI